MAAVTPNFVFLVGRQSRQDQGMIFADAGCGNESLVESEIGFAVVVQIESDRVVKGDDLVRRGVHDLSSRWLVDGEDSDSGCSGREGVGVEALLEQGDKE